jgi:hypothetical protein
VDGRAAICWLAPGFPIVGARAGFSFFLRTALHLAGSRITRRMAQRHLTGSGQKVDGARPNGFRASLAVGLGRRSVRPISRSGIVLFLLM